MKFSDLSDNWPKLIALTILTGLLFWGYGCPSKVASLVTNGKKVTRPELQIELDTIIATAEFRLTELAKQDRVRDIIFKNALLMIEGGSLNPLGIITMLAGIYGVTRGGSDLVKKVKKKNSNNSS